MPNQDLAQQSFEQELINEEYPHGNIFAVIVLFVTFLFFAVIGFIFSVGLIYCLNHLFNIITT